MKIAVIAKTRLAIAEPFHGGLEAFTHSLCREYIRKGHDVTLFAHTGSDSALHVRGFYGSEHRDDPNFDVYENDEYVSILRAIERGGYDIVHNNSTHELPIIWGVSAKLPVVTTIHTPPIAKLKAAITLSSGASNAHFVSISKSFQKTWQPYTLRGSRVIYNGVDLSKWPQVRSANDYLFWYGRIVSAKGLDIVLDVARAAGMPLRFAGSADDDAYFDAQIRPRMSERVTYLGHLDQSAILEELRNASAVINAVRWEEPFGLTNIEAMASGVPLAGFDRGAFREIVDERSGVVSKEANVRSLTDAVRSAVMLESADARRRAEEFSLKTMVKNYIEYFEELL